MWEERMSSNSRNHTDRGAMTRTVKMALDLAEYTYNHDRTYNVFRTVAMGNDLPILVNILIDETSVRFVCFLNLKSKESRYEDVCWELNEINRELMFGSFLLDPEDGMISFVYGFPYHETNVSSEFILAFMKMLVKTVDEYDGKLKKLAESIPDGNTNNTMYG